MAKKVKMVSDMSKEEVKDFCDALKYDRFIKWIGSVDTPEAKAELENLQKHTGFKNGSPMLMMVTAFFAGFEAGVDVKAALANMPQQEGEEGGPEA